MFLIAILFENDQIPHIEQPTLNHERYYCLFVENNFHALEYYFAIMLIYQKR